MYEASHRKAQNESTNTFEMLSHLDGKEIGSKVEFCIILFPGKSLSQFQLPRSNRLGVRIFEIY